MQSSPYKPGAFQSSIGKRRAIELGICEICAIQVRIGHSCINEMNVKKNSIFENRIVEPRLIEARAGQHGSRKVCLGEISPLQGNINESCALQLRPFEIQFEP